MSDGPYEPLLSAEETGALLEAMRESEGREAVSFDLTSPDARLQRHLGAADRAAEAWRERLVRAFLRHVGLLPTLEVVAVEVTSSELFFARVERGACLLRASARGGGMLALIVDASLSSFVLDRRLGATIAATQDAERTAPRLSLSSVERRVLRPFFDDLLFVPELQHAGEPVLEVGSTAIPQHPEPLLIVDLTVDLGTGVAPLVYAFDQAAARVCFPVDNAGTSAKARAATRSERASLGHRLRDAGVEVAAILGEATSTVGALLQLGVGDVVRLDTAATSDVEVRVEGVPTLLGRPCIEHGNLAVRVTGALPTRSGSNPR